MKKVIDFVKPAVILLLVAAVVALVLGLVDMMTRDRIAEIAEQTKTNAMKVVLDAPSYEQIDLDDTAPADIDEVYAAEGGWVVQVTETGSQGAITMMVGVDADLACTGISITKSSETAGLGAVYAQQSNEGEAFRSSFIGLSGEVVVSDVDAKAGATISANAICKGVTSALSFCADLG